MSFFSNLSRVFHPGAQKPAKDTQKNDTNTTIHKVPVEPIRSTPQQQKQKPAPQQKVKKQTPRDDARIMDHNDVREAQARAREIVVEAKDEALKIREVAEDDARRIRQSLNDQQRSLDQKLGNIDRKLEILDQKEENLSKIKEQLEKDRNELKIAKDSVVQKLEEVSGMTTDEAKKFLLENIEKKLTREMALMVRQKEEEAKNQADEKAREILVDAMKHGATDYVPEYTVSVVKLPDEEVKGRIIGKAGRNIHAFERVTGVDVDLDSGPDEVRLSCFDPVRREIARVALEILIKDGRIQPSRIEEVVAKVTKDIEKIMFEEGKKLCHAVGVYNMPSDIIAMLGRFKYRFSYGQNLIAHTLEETKIGIKLAHEVGANVDVVKLGCLLHDIGKVIPDAEGSHVELGVKLLRKYKMPKAVIDAVAQHHEDEPFSGVEQVLVYIADAISGARPGARYENYDEYVARLEKLEEIAMSYEPVDHAYAIQAGREVRVILQPEKSKDDDVIALSHDIKERIQTEMTYPGTVTVTVIRETRGVGVAK